MILIKEKSDVMGSLASTLCLIHCIATPFIFIAQACSVSCCEATPTWWKFIDFIFLAISFMAVYWSTQTTTIKWIKPLLWLSWFSLLFVIVNEYLEIFNLGETIIYLPAFALVALHLYNKKYCNCNEDKCCVNEG